MASFELDEGESYECEICGDVFDTNRGKGIHFSHHDNSKIKNVLLNELERLHNNIGHTPSQKDMDDHGSFSKTIYFNNFDSWNTALKEVGLEVNDKMSISKSDLVDGLKELSNELNRTPTGPDMDKYGTFSDATYQNVFGSWNDALEEAGLGVNKASHGEGEPKFYGPNWHQKRPEAIKRDDYQCRVCGLEEEKHVEKYNSGLDVHHITPVKLFGDTVEERDYSEVNDLGNLVTLCQQCHYEYGDRSNLDPRWTEYDVDEFVFFAQLDRDIQ